MSSASPPTPHAEQHYKEKGKTLLEFVGRGGGHVGDDLAVLLAHLQTACKRIAALVASPFNQDIGKRGGDELSGSDSGRDAQKPLDIISV
jgi:fructose-1,6-bisphosphatase I